MHSTITLLVFLWMIFGPISFILAKNPPLQLTFQLESDGFQLSNKIKTDADDALAFGPYHFDPWTGLFMNYQYQISVPDEPNYEKELKTIHQELKNKFEKSKQNDSTETCYKLFTQVAILKIYRLFELEDPELLDLVTKTGKDIEERCLHVVPANIRKNTKPEAKNMHEGLKKDMHIWYYDTRKYRYDMTIKTRDFDQLKQKVLLRIESCEMKFTQLSYINSLLDPNEDNSWLEIIHRDSVFLFDIYMELKKIHLSLSHLQIKS